MGIFCVGIGGWDWTVGMDATWIGGAGWVQPRADGEAELGKRVMWWWEEVGEEVGEEVVVVKGKGKEKVCEWESGSRKNTNSYEVI